MQLDPYLRRVMTSREKFHLDIAAILRYLTEFKVWMLMLELQRNRTKAAKALRKVNKYLIINSSALCYTSFLFGASASLLKVINYREANPRKSNQKDTMLALTVKSAE